MSSCPYSAICPHSLEPYSLTDQNLAQGFLKGSPKESSCEFVFKIEPAVSEKFKEFLHVRIVQEAPIQHSHVHRGIKILKRVTQGTVRGNYFKIGPSIPEKISKELLNPFPNDEF